jgi:hypothetical protein
MFLSSAMETGASRIDEDGGYCDVARNKISKGGQESERAA